ncbi:cytochrome b [Novosphingobium sp. FSY-8]|uniref:Cytochrome b n=1 Tax=Novosphingobium ovatum TaxID=1908523 RepID=A0ABW9XEH0_9SPHN|nr:cytochrome b [Novosphingobium ovatum]NBC36942.1 cytochrome b [Novosphingobium ovatum]
MSIQRYSGVAIVLHWLIAVGIIYNLVAGLGLEGLWHQVELEQLPATAARAATDLHKSIGITVLGLVAMRVLWRIGHTPPPLPEGTKPAEAKLAAAIHHTLYLLMVLVPLSGWLHDSAWKGAAENPLKLFGSIPFFRLPVFGGMDEVTKDAWHGGLGEAHEIMAFVLIAAVALHILGALKHSLIDRKPSLSRMWFGK